MLSLLSAVVSFSVHAARAEEGGPTADDLKVIRAQLQREERRMTDLRKQVDANQRSGERLGAQLEETGKQRTTLSAQLESLKGESDRLEGSLASTRGSLADRQTMLQRRVVAVYKATRGTPSLGYVFGAGNPTDLVKRMRYLAAVSEFDRNYAAVLQKMLQAMERDQSRLERLTKDKTAAVDQLGKLEQDLTDKRERKAQLLREQQDQLAKQEVVLGKLRQSAARLEQVLANIMGGERVPAPTPAPEEPPEQTTEHPEVITAPTGPTPPTEGSGIIMTPYSGRGLEALRGKLVFPVAGEMVQRFGKQRHEEFSDVLFVKGIEVKAPVGAQVRAVADGKVVLSQVLPGYGNVIIVDHGQRYYTLYGRLASSLKSLGDTVKLGEPLAVLGELDYKGRNFYFELRVKGKAVNPADYCRTLPESTTS